jgi:hypothetical protein
MRHAGFQEASGLAEGSRAHFGYWPRQQENPGIAVRITRNQIFRAAASIPANIAEGRRQKNHRDFGRFLSIALNSSSELEYHLILARDTNNMPENEFIMLVGPVVLQFAPR